MAMLEAPVYAAGLFRSVWSLQLHLLLQARHCDEMVGRLARRGAETQWRLKVAVQAERTPVQRAVGSCPSKLCDRARDLLPDTHELLLRFHCALPEVHDIPVISVDHKRATSLIDLGILLQIHAQST